MEIRKFNKDEINIFSGSASLELSKKIVEYSGNNENYAIAVVEKTVSSGWQSFYDLNFNEKKKLEQNNLQSFSLTKDYEDDELTKKLKELGV